MNITYLQHKDINKTKWDKCIKKAFNGIVYAFSWYLDIMCEEWEALIEGDYDSVFPLPAGEKYGINYLYQPFFTQQLGVFSTKKLDANKVHQFLKNIPAKYKYVDISLNTFNKISQGESLEFIKKRNITYELDLIVPYEKIFNNYSTNTKRNIKKADNNKLEIVKGLQPVELIKLFRTNLGKTIKKIKPAHYKKLIRIITISIRYNIGEIYAVYTAKNNLCAAAFFITSHNKSIFLFSGINKQGKQNSAMFLLIDEFIKKKSEKNRILDFEGSNIEGIARFYRSFGSKACEYLRIKQNKLPWYIKLLKKIVTK